MFYIAIDVVTVICTNQKPIYLILTKEKQKDSSPSEPDKKEEDPGMGVLKSNMGFEFFLGFALGLALIVVLLWQVPQFILVFAVGGLLFAGILWLLFKYLV